MEVPMSILTGARAGNLTGNLLALALAGCAGVDAPPEPSGGEDLASACIEDRIRRIQRDWIMYESVSLERIVFPDWRTHARRWAQVECERGQAVAAFHPATSATARRHY